MSLPEPTSLVRPYEYDKFHALFERKFPRPKKRAQISQWKFKREMAWCGWRWARETPYVEPKSSLTEAVFAPITPYDLEALAKLEPSLRRTIFGRAKTKR